MTSYLISICLHYYIVFALHPYHVSVCEILHNEKNSTLEITMKMFADDLEVALQAYDQTAMRWDVQVDPDGFNTVLKAYLEEKFAVWIDDRKLSIRFLGAELDADVLWCFMEISEVQALQSVRIYNAVIMEYYSDQLNLVHVESDGAVKSVQLQKGNSTGCLNLDP